MPHSAINYPPAPFLRFFAATALGLAVKSCLYSAAVSAVAGSIGPSELLRLDVLGPLIAIAYCSSAIKRRRAERSGRR